jgi:transcriptional regulator with XRE-family HTH domain
MSVFLHDYGTESSLNMQARLTPRMDTLAKRVKAARHERGMRQEDLAKASGLKQSDISKIENGLILKTTGVVALARALRCDPEWLATGEGKMQSERTWPFVELKAEQLLTLHPDDLATVEKVALDLWNRAKKPAPSKPVRAENAAGKGGEEMSSFVSTPKEFKAHGNHPPVSKKAGNRRTS